MVSSSRKNTTPDNESEYRRKWLYQLQSEFKQVCSWYRVSLAPPAFRISNSSVTLGSWNPATRTINISACLINEYSWDAVINVLKHEMAHQYVHEFLDRGMEQPHGKSFAKACEKLGVMFPFNTPTGDTHKIFTAAGQHDSDPEYDRKVNKVRKILSLAGSANRHEAAVAMVKANSLIRKYNLERLGGAGPAHYIYKIVNTGKKRLQVIERKIAGILMDFFYVDIVYAELFDPVRLESFKTIEMLGSSENVAFAGHVYDFLSSRVEFLWHNYRASQKAPGKLRKTYIIGLLQGFREKLAKEEKKYPYPAETVLKSDSNTFISALVVAKDPRLKEFTAGRFPRLRKVKQRPPAIYCMDTFTAGKSEGRKISIFKAVHHEDGNMGRQLGNSSYKKCPEE